LAKKSGVPPSANQSSWSSGSAADVLAREVLGYLNFSNGRPDSKFQGQLNQLATLCQDKSWAFLAAQLSQTLTLMQRDVPAFSDVTQAHAVLDLVFGKLAGAYRAHHQDLLFHVNQSDWEQPFLLARFCEAVLSQGSPWDEAERIVQGALDTLNDYVGYRPIAVLENGRRSEVYPHERLRPVPIYIKGAGVATGRYQAVIEKMLELMQTVPPEMRHNAHFDLELLDELAIDLRAHDHLHPVNKRTNYLFGEWDPHHLDVSGRFRRFILRRIILDALIEWVESQKRVSQAEVLFDAGAVLCGTILMASAISGSSPETHDSSITLTSLLPKVARQRDEFYYQLMESTTGPRRKRLEKHAQQTRQPFGHVRQSLNMFLAQYGTQQVQRRHLSFLFARMGYPEESLRQALMIPAVAARFEAEIQGKFTHVRQLLEAGMLPETVGLLDEIQALLKRGIECGAICDPWSILGFQGQYPLFSSREDSVPDQRAEILYNLIEMILFAYSASLQEASARNNDAAAKELSARFESFAEWWDKFGTTAVGDLSQIKGIESYESARHVAKALADWSAAGEAAGDITFWRNNSEGFRSVKAYAQVVEALLDRKDSVASMGLLMQWLSQADEVGLEAGPHSFFALIVAWFDVALETTDVKARWTLIRRMFDYLEANAGGLWNVPAFQGDFAALASHSDEDNAEVDELLFGGSSDIDDDEDDNEVFGAAYDGVQFRDSADDGELGEMLSGGRGPGEPTEFEVLENHVEHQVKFLRVLAQLWQMAATEYGLELSRLAEANSHETLIDSEYLEGWLTRAQQLQADFLSLIALIWEQPIADSSGDQDSNIEYDVQLQTKFYLLQNIVATHSSCQSAEWCIASALSEEVCEKRVGEEHRLIVAVYRGITRRDVALVRKLLPQLQRFLQRKPLLYIPLDHNGDPKQVIAARSMQAVMRFLLAHLPRLGLIRETWHLLRTAHQMERSSRPDGMAVTEFDRLFKVALRNSLESVVDTSAKWKSGKFSDEELIEVVGSIVEFYLDQWLHHSSTMRLSSVEALKNEDEWDEIVHFIERYGEELLHARSLTLGHVRAILHQGVEQYLDYLEENEDPLEPSTLLEDLRNGAISREEVSFPLELIYQIVVDRFDRFIEYNSTTTQSDYGQQFHAFLDFLRLEIGYDRDAWNLMPVSIAHEVLVRRGRPEAAQIWEEVFSMKTEEMADKHLADLVQLERKYGMRLPSVTNHLNERFVKPLSVNKMLALIPRAVEDTEKKTGDTKAFQELVAAVEEYLLDTSGSGLEVPAWLRSLEDELNDGPSSGTWTRGDAEPELNLPAPQLNLREMRQQLKAWKQPLVPRHKP
jgi:hypothetical protein